MSREKTAVVEPKKAAVDIEVKVADAKAQVRPGVLSAILFLCPRQKAQLGHTGCRFISPFQPALVAPAGLDRGQCRNSGKPGLYRYQLIAC